MIKYIKNGEWVYIPDEEIKMKKELNIASPSAVYLEMATNQIKKALTHAILVGTGCQPIKIIQNGPATIVFWNDRTKTVVKRKDTDQDDIYAAFAQAYMIKIYGSNHKVHSIVDKAFVRQTPSPKEEI